MIRAINKECEKFYIVGDFVLLLTLTNFADQGVILPVIAVVTIMLLLVGWVRGAMAWLCIICAVLALIGAGKVATYACLLALPTDWDIRSPSGHTASAAVVYGGLLGLLAPRHRRQATAAISAVIFAMLFGASRVLLGLHTTSDVFVGAAVGVCGAVAVAHIAGPRPAGMYSSRLIVLAAPLCVALFHGSHVHAEPWIGAIAKTLRPFAQCSTMIGPN